MAIAQSPARASNNKKRNQIIAIVLIAGAISAGVIIYFSIPGTGGIKTTQQGIERPRVLDVEESYTRQFWFNFSAYLGTKDEVLSPDVNNPYYSVALIEVTLTETEIASYLGLPLGKDELYCLNGTPRVIWGHDWGKYNWYMLLRGQSKVAFQQQQIAWYVTPWGGVIGNNVPNEFISAAMKDPRFGK